MTIPILKPNSARYRLLNLLVNNVTQSYYLRELASQLSVDPTNLSRELRKLEAEEVVLSETRGLQKYCRINPQYEFYVELRSILKKMAANTVTNKHAYIIAGPNGAGKTTFAKVFLPKYAHCRTFINADLIAGGLAPFKPDEVVFKAGKLLLAEVRSAAHKGEDFGFETTLSGRSYMHLFKRLKDLGYTIHLFFLWIPSLELSIKRIQDRVKRGGHHIPDDVAKRRFYRGISNLFDLYDPLIDSWSLMDNSGTSPMPIVSKHRGDLRISNNDLYKVICKKAKSHEEKNS